MIVIPDLFGSYQRGREEAIKNNWNDLAQYESIESSRHQNDAQALANLATMADFGHKRQMTSNEATNSNLTTELNKATQVGKLLNADANNTLSLVNRNTINSNVPMLYDIAGYSLGTAHNNAQTGWYNSGTNAYNANSLFTVTKLLYPKTTQALYTTHDAKLDVSNIQASVAPLLARIGADTSVINADTSLEQARQNNKVTGINGQYLEEKTHLANKVNLADLANSIIQKKIDKGTLEHTLKTLPAKQRQEIASMVLQYATAANDPDATKAAYAMLGDISQDLWKLAGGKGSVPIINYATGEVMGTANADGTVSSTSGTGGTGTNSTDNTTRGATATTPTAVASNNLFGMPAFTQYRPVATVNVVRPMGGQGSPLIKVPVYNQGSRNPTATDYAGWWGAY